MYNIASNQMNDFRDCAYLQWFLPVHAPVISYDEATVAQVEKIQKEVLGICRSEPKLLRCLELCIRARISPYPTSKLCDATLR